MTELSDPILATKYVLEQSPVVAAAMGGTMRVYGMKVPDDVAPLMPLRGVVVKPSGGTGMGAGSSDTLGVSVRRVDVWCYGRTPFEAAQVQTAVAYALKRFRPGSVRRHYVHWFTYSSGPTAFDDPDFDWPTQVVTFQLQLADELA